MPALDFTDLIPGQRKKDAAEESGAMTFEDLLPENTRLKSAHGPLTFEEMTPQQRVEKFGKIEEWTTADRAIDQTLRTTNVATNALLGDVPFVRNLLPERVRGADPEMPSEKIVAPLIKVGRDIALYGGTGKLIKPLTTIKPATVTKTGRYISKAVQELIKGGATGAATAGSEDIGDIAKNAAIYGGVAAGTVPLVSTVSWAGGKVANALGRSEKLNRFGEWLGTKLRENKANELVRKHYGDINSKLIDSEKFLDDLQRQITPDEDKALVYLVERGADSLKNEPIKKTVVQIRNYLDDAHADLVANYGDDVGFVKNYVPHLWDIPKNKEAAVTKWFATRNIHLNKRRIETIEEGIKKFGLKPKYDKITDIVRAYDGVRIRTASNFKFVKDLKELEAGGVKLLQRADKAPKDWPIIDHPAVRRAMGVRVGKGEDAKLLLSKVPVRVHPDIYPEVNAVLDTYRPGAAAKTLDTVNTFVKQSVLNLSLFHHLALTETAVAAGMGRDVLKVWNPVRIIKAFKNGTYKNVLQQSDIAKTAVKDGLNIGAISDVEGGRTLVNALKAAEKNVGNAAIATGIKATIRKPLEFNNKFLWDYLHTTYKLNAYSKLKTDMLKAFPDKDPLIVGKEVAQFVNDTFGGQSWEIMAKSTQWKQFSRFLLLSPDWVLSTMKQAVSPFGVGAASKAGVEIRKELGQDFWRRAIVYFGGSMNLLNHAYTKAYTGQGRYMWENPPGKETYLFVGYNPDGTERYLRWGKQFRELAEAISDPTSVASRKVSPLIRMTKNQLWPSEMWQREIVDNKFWSKAGLTARAETLAKDVTPYSITQQQRVGDFTPLSFAMPVSRGMTPYSAKKFFRMAVIDGDKELAQRTFKASLDNGVDPEPLLKAAIGSIKAEKTFEARQDAQKILIEYNKRDPEDGEIYLKKLRQDGKITPLVLEELNKLLKKKGKAKAKKQAFDRMSK
jgi:hypothetical protein